MPPKLEFGIINRSDDLENDLLLMSNKNWFWDELDMVDFSSSFHLFSQVLTFHLILRQSEIFRAWKFQFINLLNQILQIKFIYNFTVYLMEK